MSDTPITSQMAHLAGEITEATIEGQSAGLRLLAAEMEALTQIIPGFGLPLTETAPRSDAEIEADFGNMPV